MTLLNIHKLEACPIRQAGGGHITIHQALQFIIGQQWIIRIRSLARGFVDESARVEERIVARQKRPAIAVAARMSQLQADYKVIIGAESGPVHLPAFGQQTRELAGIVFVKQQLARIGSAFFDDSGRLAPNELGAACAESMVAAERQGIRPTVECAVAAFHRLDAHGVAGTEGTKGDRAEQGAQIVAEGKCKTKAPALGLQICDGMEFEIAGHDKPNR
jgi:hypothetical protein